MVLIRLPATVVGLIVTLTSLICELAFLTAALLFLKYVNCRNMLKHQQLRLRLHKRKVTSITLLAMFIFVALEILLSVSSEAVLQTGISVQDCVRTIAKKNVTYATGYEAEAVHFRCAKVSGVNITHHIGNYSLQNIQIACSDKVAYSFVIGKERKVKWRDGKTHCDYRSCATVFLRGDLLYFTGIHGPRKPGEKLTVLPTLVPGIKLTKKGLPKLSRRLSEIYELPVRSEVEVRRRLLLGSVRAKCPFVTKRTQATRVPIGVITTAVCVWSISLLLLGVSALFRRNIFFDLGDPIHWASRARHDVPDALGNEPKVQWDESLERLRIMSYEEDRNALEKNWDPDYGFDE